MSKLLTVDEAAARLSIATGTLYHWTSKDRITHIKIGGKLLFREADIDGFIEASTVKVRTQVIW